MSTLAAFSIGAPAQDDLPFPQKRVIDSHPLFNRGQPKAVKSHGQNSFFSGEKCIDQILHIGNVFRADDHARSTFPNLKTFSGGVSLKWS